jgi:hypothetical protein
MLLLGLSCVCEGDLGADPDPDTALDDDEGFPPRIGKKLLSESLPAGRPTCCRMDPRFDWSNIAAGGNSMLAPLTLGLEECGDGMDAAASGGDGSGCLASDSGIDATPAAFLLDDLLWLIMYLIFSGASRRKNSCWYATVFGGKCRPKLLRKPLV